AVEFAAVPPHPPLRVAGAFRPELRLAAAGVRLHRRDLLAAAPRRVPPDRDRAPRGTPDAGRSRHLAPPQTPHRRPHLRQGGAGGGVGRRGRAAGNLRDSPNHERSLSSPYHRPGCTGRRWLRETTSALPPVTTKSAPWIATIAFSISANAPTSA